jgi:glucan biosynthesis protein C
MAENATHTRTHSLDNLRSALVILVVAHHVAVVYSGVAPFYYVEPPFLHPAWHFNTLASFALFNQAWFMGALFLVAGYFTPDALDRKGRGGFVASRLKRLGIPILLSIFIFSPLAATGYWLMPATLTGITDPLSWAAYPYLWGVGVLWFAALLLLFGVVYALLPAQGVDKMAERQGRITLAGVILFTAALALLSYLWRFVVPLDREVALSYLFKFPTLGYLPQYLGLFLAGIIAQRRGWFETLTPALGGLGFTAAVLAAIVLYPLALSGRMFAIAFSEASPFTGNGHWQSAVYAAWDSITAVGLSLAAVVLFRCLFDSAGPVSRFLSRQSFAVYVIHTPVVVFTAHALRGIALTPVQKTLFVVAVAVPLCFVLAWTLRRMPLLGRVF